MSAYHSRAATEAVRTENRLGIILQALADTGEQLRVPEPKERRW